MHGAAHQTDAATGGLGGADHGIHARHVGGEAGHRHLVVQALDQVAERVADVGLGAGDDRAALVAGRAVRRLELDAVALVRALEVLEDALVGGFEDREAGQRE